MAGDPIRFPIGAAITVDQLEREPYRTLAELRVAEPVSWVPALGGWVVTRRDLVVEALRDAETFTVDDPRFTTAAVLGPSMLSLDGPEHRRRRQPFIDPFRPAALEDELGGFLAEEAARLVDRAWATTTAGIELRTELAAPLAATTVTRLLGLDGVTVAEVLRWYQSIVAAVTDLTAGRPTTADDRSSVEQLRQAVARTIGPDTPSSLLSQVHHRTDGAAPTEAMIEALAADAGVLMFGAIETTEGMIANAFWHLLTTPWWETLAADRSLLDAVIDESLRLEPAAAVVDRYTTTSYLLGPVEVPAGDLVTLSLLAANRDPAVFDDPDRFDPGRPGGPRHLTFAQGPHACLGAHLARMEAAAAIGAVLDLDSRLRSRGGGLELDDRAAAPPFGLVFRKPPSVVVRDRSAARS